MGRRLSFSRAQPITILGWYIASFLLVALVAVTARGLKLPPPDNRALNQAFYYAIMSAALYFIVATLMCFTVYGAARGAYPKEFELTTSQRTLMIQTIFFFIYLLGGSAVFARIESWKFLDAVYWCDFTLLTVGIGDYAPMTHLGRSLLFPYAILGIVNVGLVVGSIRAMVLERGKKKLGARMVEKTREKVVQKIDRKGGKVKLNPLSKGHTLAPDDKSEQKRREDEFELMRQIQDHAATRRKWTSLSVSIGAWFFLWFIGAVVFYRAERNQSWTYFGSLYFSYTSLLTIGYGDFRLYSNSGKPFFVFWSLLAVPTLTILVSNMGDTVVKSIKDFSNWLGEFTVLPGEVGARERFKKGASNLIKRKDSSEDIKTDEPPGLLGESQHDIEQQRRGIGGPGMDCMAKDFEDSELIEENKAADRGEDIDKDIHHYHYLLVKEIRNVMRDLNQSPPRQYSYHEWAWFLRLMGEDENSSKSHRKAPGKLKPDGSEDIEVEGAGIDDQDEDEDRHQWSWLGTKSPLMGETEEAEWILEKLSLTLEKDLKKERDKQRRATHGHNNETEIKTPRQTSTKEPSTKEPSTEEPSTEEPSSSRCSSKTLQGDRSHGRSRISR
ncbi:MAG: hypothetical protein Q9187_003253 [Circinaria calcarea]